MARILGIDIDRTSVRGVVLKTAFRRTEIERYIKVPISQSPESAGRITELHAAFEGLLLEIGRAPDVVVSSLDGEVASLRVVELPLAAAKRAAEVLPFEMESLLPFEISEAVLDYQPIETREGMLRLLAAAALKERVREHLAQFAGSAIDPREVAVGAAALDGLRVLCPELTQGHRMIVEICEREVTSGASRTAGRRSRARCRRGGGAPASHARAEPRACARRSPRSGRRRHGGRQAVPRGARGRSRRFASELAQELEVSVELLTLPARRTRPT